MSRRGDKRPTTTCPNDACPHPVLLHEIEERPGPRIERCTVMDCQCWGVEWP